MEEAPVAFGAAMITAILQPMAKRAEDEILHHLGKMLHIKTEINNLQNTLYGIQGVIQDAEDKQMENNHIRDWLWQLVDIGYESRDVLDDFFTYCALKRARRASRSVNLDFLHTQFKFGSPSIPFTVKHRLASDIRTVREKLDELMRQNEIVSKLKSVLGPSQETVPEHTRPKTGPLQDKQRDLFVGRECVKEDVMQKILNHSDDRVHIIPILGMGGIGKTTLAQSIYNDVRVTESDMYPTKNRVWHCVGEKKLNAEGIITSFVDGLDPTSSLEVIQKRLVEKFKGDKFLIVLDDVWDVDRNEWKLLFEPLTNVGKGGVVILTTRISKVVDATNTQIPDSLQLLSDEECCSIFESYAFPDGDSNSRQDLKSIGKQIVAKLKGLPLAAQVVGCSLLNEPDEETWKSFLVTKEWLLKNDDDDIMLALKWSYSRLPPHLKQCFRYCSLFPKDHEFDEKTLIKIWMAHDIVLNVGRGGESRRPEDVGAEYFKELVNASFFQCINGKYVMHDMIHDLALLVSSGEFITVSKYSLPHQMDKVRHVKIMEDEDHKKYLRLLHTLNKRILTLFLNTDTVYLDVGQAFKHMTSVRVLVLSSTKVTKVPDCIKELKHLRYLDVRGTKVKTLPDSLCNLYYLQTLATNKDVFLPKDVGNLVNLRHLRGATLDTYNGIAKLSSLQELSTIRVISKGGSIRELGDLGELRGELQIKGLGNVTSSEDAAQAKMQEKTHIDLLTLRFDGKASNAEDDVLEALNCPPKLKSLEICDYNGRKFPSWLTNAASDSMRYLSSLTIENCPGVELLEFDAFVSLKLLNVGCCSDLECIKLGKAEEDATIEDLTIYDCRKLMDIKIESLPSLRKLWLSKCKRLGSFPPCLVKIEKLQVSGCEELSSLMFTFEGVKSLKYLDVTECSMLKHFSIVQEGSTSSSSSSSTTKLSLPDDRKITFYTHQFEVDAQGRLVLTRREDVE